jgi:hypothetical protein
MPFQRLGKLSMAVEAIARVGGSEHLSTHKLDVKSQWVRFP